MIDIGLILKGLRVENNFTQARLANRLGVTVSTIVSWEAGTKFPQLARLIDLSKLYHVPLNYLAGIDKDESIVLDNLTQRQINILKTLILEFQDKGKHPPGLTDRQKNILNDLVAEFSQ